MPSNHLIKNLLQHHNLKASVLWCSAFFKTNPYLTTGKTIALTIQTFVGKVISLLFNTPCRLVIAFVARSKHLLISWLQSLSAGIWEFRNIKSVTVSIVSTSICHEMMGPDAMILVFWMLSFKPGFHAPLSFSSGGSSVPLCFFYHHRALSRVPCAMQ